MCRVPHLSSICQLTCLSLLPATHPCSSHRPQPQAPQEVVVVVVAPPPPSAPLAHPSRAGWPAWRTSNTYSHPSQQQLYQHHHHQQQAAAAARPRRQQQQLPAARHLQQQQEGRGLLQQVVLVVSRCQVLRRSKGHTTRPRGLLQSPTWPVVQAAAAAVQQQQLGPRGRLVCRGRWHPRLQVGGNKGEVWEGGSLQGVGHWGLVVWKADIAEGLGSVFWGAGA